jgi:kynurenine formamidase
MAGCAAEPAKPIWEREIVDLTHTFEASTIYWPTAERGFVLHPEFAGVTETGFYYSSNSFTAPEHGGTHVDAPIHFFETGQTLDAVPVDRLIGPGVLVDVESACRQNPDYLVGISDLESWERRHGRIPRGAIVLLRTGHGKFWPDRKAYMGTDEIGADAVPKLHFPGLNAEAATWLAVERSIGAVGLDTPSIDHGPSTEFAAHVNLMAHDVPALENVAHLELLPETGFTVVALPIKIGGGSGGPLRIVAILD